MIIEDRLVLVVDDSDVDGVLMRAVFTRAGVAVPLRFVSDGVDAIAYLHGTGVYADRLRFPMPTVMLLDLNMPRKNGFEVLAWLRQQPELKRLCVFILSSSSRAEDIDRSYDLGANSYLVKPTNLDGLTHLARTLVEWLNVSHFAALTAAHNTEEFAPAGNGRSHPEFAAGHSAQQSA